MSLKRLFIIGNGFDLHHGIESRYWNFREYLINENSELLEKLEEYFSPDDLWSDFEETLANLDTEEIVDECMNYLQSYSAEDWSDAYHHDYQYEVQKRIDLITETLKECFTEWVLQLQLPENANDNLIKIDRNAIFINFNYTDTLESLYKVPRQNIFYIHNKAIDKNSTLILGHSRKPGEKKSASELYDDEDIEVRIAEGDEILDTYFIQTYKSTETIIMDNAYFFDNLSDIEEINVFGHSLSVVDLPYLREVIKKVDSKTTKWKVSFYNKDELIRHKETMQSLGINLDLVEFDKIDNFGKAQLALFPLKI